MNFPILASRTSSVSQFFERFGASEAQQKAYKPLFLAINYSTSGEQAESFGLFTKSGNLYSVYGTECSVWDFNGQFDPQITNINSLMKEIKNGLGKSDFLVSEDVFQEKLVQLIKDIVANPNLYQVNLEGSTEKVDSYVKFLNAKEIQTFETKENVATIFNGHLREVEENLKFYQFDISNEVGNYSFFVREQGKKWVISAFVDQPFMEDLLNFHQDYYVQHFVSDFLGSLDIQENIFIQPQKETSKMKIK